MKKKCELYVVIAAVLWGCIAVFHNLLRHEGFSHIQIVTIRVTSAAAVLTVYLLARAPQMLRIRLRDWWCFAGTGIAGLLTFNWCYFVAMEMTGRAVAAALLYTAPAFVLLLSAVLFKEPLTTRKISALALALTGSVLVSGFSGVAHVIQRAGLLPAVGAGFSYALYSIFGKIALRKGYCAETISEYTFLFAAACAVPLSRIWSISPPPNMLTTGIGALGVGVICCVFPFLLYTKGLAGTDAGKAAVLAMAEPAVATLLGCVLYREVLGAGTAVGIGLIFCSLLTLTCPEKRRRGGLPCDHSGSTK